MKIIRAILFGIFIFGAICKAQDDTAKFRYRAKKQIPVGTVLHYVKTNIDGTQPEYVSQYIASDNVMEAFKFHPKGSRAGFVVAEMDWQTFSAKSLKSWQVFPKNQQNLFGTILFDGAKRQAEVSIPVVRKEPETFAINHLPIHLYNFDLGSLNFAFPHLVKPKSSFTIGIADPTFQDKGALVEYKGEATVSYQTTEKRNNVKTRKYRIDGAGLKNRGGFIWVNKKRGWIEDMEIALPDNPSWTSFKLKLLRVEKMSRAEWDKFREAQF
ncbi:MAG: hypothetical protein M3209_12260 [Acidobacteriota bacterium]|nr:hypothetical protein [Acidobacteriota bacterium]